MEIPLRCILTTETARRSETGRAITASGVQVSNSQSYPAAVLLAGRRSETSFWHPYIAALPPAFPTFPLFFDDRELAMLKGSYTLKMIERQKQQLTGDYQRLRRRVPHFAGFTYREFVWARLAVASRIFSFQTGGGKVYGLVPLADLLNHRCRPETDWDFDDSTGVLRVTSSRQIGTGDPIHDSYGAKCNSDFFVNYGFALPDNDHNSARIVLPDMSVQRRFEGLLNRLCDRAGEEADDFGVTADLRSAGKLLSFLRLVYADDAEQVRVPNTREVHIMPISKGNETRVLRALQRACTAALSAFNTSLIEDEALLDFTCLSPNERNAITVRRGEKVVLHRYWKLAEIMLPLLRLPDAHLAHILKAPPASIYGLGGYLSSLHGVLQHGDG
jgi:histone-lysine N-methyltransferase SETD3